VGATLNVVASSLLLKSLLVYTLIDQRATHSFVSYQNVDKLHVIPCKMSKLVTVSALL
jgi:hypothetical protein